jgi:hypothetical protein
MAGCNTGVLLVKVRCTTFDCPAPYLLCPAVMFVPVSELLQLLLLQLVCLVQQHSHGRPVPVRPWLEHSQRILRRVSCMRRKDTKDSNVKNTVRSGKELR